MDLNTVIDSARHARNEAARTMDALGTGGQGIEQARTAIMNAMLAGGATARRAEAVAEPYVKAVRAVQDLNEALYGRTGQLADAAEAVNRAMTARGGPNIF